MRFSEFAKVVAALLVLLVATTVAFHVWARPLSKPVAPVPKFLVVQLNTSGEKIGEWRAVEVVPTVGYLMVYLRSNRHVADWDMLVTGPYRVTRE